MKIVIISILLCVACGHGTSRAKAVRAYREIAEQSNTIILAVLEQDKSEVPAEKRKVIEEVSCPSWKWRRPCLG